MAELFVQIAVSLDGFIEDHNGGLEWFVDDASLDDVSTATLGSIDGMIFGRKAHELLAKFWPGAGETAGASAALKKQAALMNTLPKFVLTHGRERTGWTNSHAIKLDDISRIKREANRPIALFAGASAVQAALAESLVDEIRLIRYPILLGAGTPLFANGGKRRDLELTSVDKYDSGATVECYAFKPVRR